LFNIATIAHGSNVTSINDLGSSIDNLDNLISTFDNEILDTDTNVDTITVSELDQRITKLKGLHQTLIDTLNVQLKNSIPNDWHLDLQMMQSKIERLTDIISYYENVKKTLVNDNTFLPVVPNISLEFDNKWQQMNDMCKSEVGECWLRDSDNEQSYSKMSFDHIHTKPEDWPNNLSTCERNVKEMNGNQDTCIDTKNTASFLNTACEHIADISLYDVGNTAEYTHIPNSRYNASRSGSGTNEKINCSVDHSGTLNETYFTDINVVKEKATNNCHNNGHHGEDRFSCWGLDTGIDINNQSIVSRDAQIKKLNTFSKLWSDTTSSSNKHGSCLINDSCRSESELREHVDHIKEPNNWQCHTVLQSADGLTVSKNQTDSYKKVYTPGTWNTTSNTRDLRTIAYADDTCRSLADANAHTNCLNGNYKCYEVNGQNNVVEKSIVKKVYTQPLNVNDATTIGTCNTTNPCLTLEQAQSDASGSCVNPDTCYTIDTGGGQMVSSMSISELPAIANSFSAGKLTYFNSQNNNCLTRSCDFPNSTNAETLCTSQTTKCYNSDNTTTDQPMVYANGLCNKPSTCQQERSCTYQTVYTDSSHTFNSGDIDKTDCTSSTGTQHAWLLESVHSDSDNNRNDYSKWSSDLSGANNFCSRNQTEINAFNNTDKTRNSTEPCIFDVNFNDNSLISNVDGVGFEGINYTPNDGFVTVAPGGFLELDGILPNYIAQSITDQSWLIQFRAISGSFRLKMALTTSPSSTNYFADLTGLHIFIEHDEINATIFRSPGNPLARAFARTTGVDLGTGIHQIVVTYNPNTLTFKLYFDDNSPITDMDAPIDEPIFYATGSTIVLNKWLFSSPGQNTEYHRVANYNRVLSESEIKNSYNEANHDIEPDVAPIITNLLQTPALVEETRTCDENDYHYIYKANGEIRNTHDELKLMQCSKDNSCGTSMSITKEQGSLKIGANCKEISIQSNIYDTICDACPAPAQLIPGNVRNLEVNSVTANSFTYSFNLPDNMVEYDGYIEYKYVLTGHYEDEGGLSQKNLLRREEVIPNASLVGANKIERQIINTSFTFNTFFHYKLVISVRIHETADYNSGTESDKFYYTAPALTPGKVRNLEVNSVTATSFTYSFNLPENMVNYKGYIEFKYVINREQRTEGGFLSETIPNATSHERILKASDVGTDIIEGLIDTLFTFIPYNMYKLSISVRIDESIDGYQSFTESDIFSYTPVESPQVSTSDTTPIEQPVSTTTSDTTAVYDLAFGKLFEGRTPFKPDYPDISKLSRTNLEIEFKFNEYVDRIMWVIVPSGHRTLTLTDITISPNLILGRINYGRIFVRKVNIPFTITSGPRLTPNTRYRLEFVLVDGNKKMSPSNKITFTTLK
jgi:hypothetical protein